jgi:hypothetical protein
MLPFLAPLLGLLGGSTGLGGLFASGGVRAMLARAAAAGARQGLTRAALRQAGSLVSNRGKLNTGALRGQMNRALSGNGGGGGGVSVEVDQRQIDRLNKLLVQFGPYLIKNKKGTGIIDVIKQQASLLCEDLSRFTPPIGDDKKGLEEGRKTVGKDIGKVYKVVKQSNGKPNLKLPLYLIAEQMLFTKSAERLLEGRGATVRHPALRRIINSVVAGHPEGRKRFIRFMRKTTQAKMDGKVQMLASFDGGAAHRASRKQGRVSRKNIKTSYWLMKEIDRKRYIAQRQQYVGLMKSGWADAAKLIYPKRKANFPGWVKRNQRGYGYIVDESAQLQPESPFLITQDRPISIGIGNKIGNAWGIAVKKKTLDNALAGRADKFKTYLMHSLKNNMQALKQLNNL